MKIRFLDDTYIRIAPKASGNDPIGSVFKGTEIEVDAEVVQGDLVQHNNRWYRDKNGWYYWSGRAEQVEEEEEEAVGPVHEGLLVAPTPGETPEPPREVPGDIPSGETRRVPSLEELLELDKKQRAGLLDTPTVPALLEPEIAEPVRIVEQIVRPEAEAMPAARVVEAPADQPRFWENPATQKLNWAVRQYRIAQDWWQERRMTGRGIRIAVLSTGISPDHPDLVRPADTFQSSGAAEEVNDKHGLGTQAALVVAGTGQHVFGVAPEAQLLVGKIGEQDYSITADGLLAGLRWAIHSGADIIAMLVDFPELEEARQAELQGLIDEAVGKGMLLVAPVGTLENKRPENRYPACLKGVFSVGAHDQYGQRSPFSARSYALDLLAPGEGLLVSDAQGTTASNMKSTSVAAAFTAGFMALILQWQRKRGEAAGPDAVYDLLRNNAAARRSFNRGEDVEYGYGILNPIEVLKKLDEHYQTQS